MHRFILTPEALAAERVLLDKKESHHARDVLRVKPGQAVELFDGRGGRYLAVVAGFEQGRVALSVDRRLPAGQAGLPAGRQGGESAPGGIAVTLAPAVIRPERMEWMLEKSCELGAGEWAPVLTERGIVKLSRERWQAKVERWRKIAQETCKQCGQPRVPKIAEPVSLATLASRIGSFDLALIPTLAVPGISLGEAFAKAKNAEDLLILTGPEGDFTPNEVREALKAGALAVDLGTLVLRAETAAIFALSAARFFFASCDKAKSKEK